MSENPLVKKVRNMITGQIFDSLSHAARSCNITAQVLRNKIIDSEHGRGGIVLDKYVFCFIGKDGVELSTIHQKNMVKNLLK